jgi:hypothetical protein
MMAYCFHSKLLAQSIVKAFPILAVRGVIVKSKSRRGGWFFAYLTNRYGWGSNTGLRGRSLLTMTGCAARRPPPPPGKPAILSRIVGLHRGNNLKIFVTLKGVGEARHETTAC